MNELEIENLILMDVQMSKYFRGVFSYDELPRTCMTPSLYVVNTDSSLGVGKHWVCIFIELDGVEYFDSLGRKPKELLFFLESLNRPYTISNKQIQNFASDVCGDYCIIYSYLRCRGYQLDWFLNFFNLDLTKNDNMVRI